MTPDPDMMWVGPQGAFQIIKLRDYFAGQALAGLVQIHADRRDPVPCVAPVRLAYEYADAMLAERAKGGKP